MATVYLGTKHGAAGFERLVAIKRCHPHLGDDDEFVTMFLDEARLAARIHHPNVVATLDVDCAEVPYLVMDYVEGESFGALLRRARKQNATIPIEVTVRVMIDALSGLHAAHELRDLDGSLLNLVHRDVSPQNILVGVDGISRITDFGIAFAGARATVTQAGRIKGKFSYMSPEQVKGDQVTRRIDVFGAGIVLWEALTGRALFRRADDGATINAVLNEKVPAPSSVAKRVPTALDAIVLKALERDPERRYQTAAELADALEQLTIQRPTSRVVAAYVDGAIGPMLAERRALVRDVLERQSLDDQQASDVHPKPITLPQVTLLSDDDIEELGVEGPLATLPNAAAETPEVEHRRMRGLLAAAMLLLVGSAVGLLLARMNSTPSVAPAPSTSAAVPASVR